MLKALLAVIRRDLLLAWRRRSDALTTLAFFAMVASLFPFGVGAESSLLQAIAPGILWVAALLATLLSLGRLFAADYADGTLEQMALSPEPLVLIVLGKVFAYWLVTGLPLVLLSPLLGLMFDLGGSPLWVLVLSLLLGTPALCLLGAVGAALTLGLRGGGVLIALLILPLYVPILIFGAGSVGAEVSGLGAQPNLLLLAACLLIGFAVAPWATAAGLRIALE